MRKFTAVHPILLATALSLMAACSSGTVASQPGEGSSATGSAAATVDPSKISGLDIVSDNSEQSSCPYATSYPAVPGAAAMTAAMKHDVDRRLAEFRASACQPGSNSAAEQGPELNISHEFLVASGDVLGVRLSTQDRSTSVGDGLSTRTYWYDGKTGTYRTALGLIADGSRDAFVSALKKELRRREGVVASTLDAALDDPANRAAAVDDLAFTSDGGLRVSFDRGEVGVPAAGRYTVTFSEKTATAWLSAFGKRAQRQSVHPDAHLDVGATSTPAESAPAQAAVGDDNTDCKKVKCVALTFDDGPAAPETSTLLTYLAQYKARVTFFTVGQNVVAHPDLVRAEAKAGHEVGNHSWNHPDLTRLSTREIRYQLNRTSAAIKAATGKAPTLFRPPYGAVDAKVTAATTLSPVLWNVDTEDWKYPDAKKVAATVISKVSRNDVVLMHDIHPTSVAAVPEILRVLTARGYHFVTVSHLRATD
ncbi:polysaccharide deacetylase family protein [Streptomyces sp. NPDC058464]|uniref:polysaccharide deacetylase family protein n=1 Tax=Streptomyces sp. NPDC058464 TaxID=3346511 RepID=UPI00365BD691